MIRSAPREAVAIWFDFWFWPPYDGAARGTYRECIRGVDAARKKVYIMKSYRKELWFQDPPGGDLSI